MSDRRHWKAEEKLALINEIKENGQYPEKASIQGSDH
jgi:hypothetical protein